MPLIRKDTGTPGPAPTPPGVELLTTGAVDERWAAARALADRDDSAPILAAALPTEGEPRVREAILTGLVRHGGDLAVRAVLPQIRSDDAARRTEALDALRAMPQAMAPYLRELLDDADPDVRLLSCDLARVASPEEAAQILCDRLDRETEVNVCAAAIDALAEIGGPPAAPALRRCAQRFPHEAFLGFSIKAAMQRIGADPAA